MNNGSKLDQFRGFVKNNTFLISYVKNGEKTWQDMYEIYDLYGEDEDAWEKFLMNANRENVTQKSNHHFDEFVRMAKNIDVNKVQEGITSLQKTLGLFGELFTSKNGNNGSGDNTYNPRPLYRRFED